MRPQTAGNVSTVWPGDEEGGRARPRGAARRGCAARRRGRRTRRATGPSGWRGRRTPARSRSRRSRRSGRRAAPQRASATFRVAARPAGVEVRRGGAGRRAWSPPRRGGWRAGASRSRSAAAIPSPSGHSASTPRAGPGRVARREHRARGRWRRGGARSPAPEARVHRVHLVLDRPRVQAVAHAPEAGLRVGERRAQDHVGAQGREGRGVLGDLGLVAGRDPDDGRARPAPPPARRPRRCRSARSIGNRWVFSWASTRPSGPGQPRDVAQAAGVRTRCVPASRWMPRAAASASANPAAPEAWRASAATAATSASRQPGSRLKSSSEHISGQHHQVGAVGRVEQPAQVAQRGRRRRRPGRADIVVAATRRVPRVGHGGHARPRARGGHPPPG